MEEYSPPSSPREVLFSTDRDHYRKKDNQSKCKVVEPCSSDTSRKQSPSNEDSVNIVEDRVERWGEL